MIDCERHGGKLLIRQLDGVQSVPPRNYPMTHIDQLIEEGKL